MEQPKKKRISTAKKWIIGGGIVAVLVVFWAIGINAPEEAPKTAAVAEEPAEVTEPAPEPEKAEPVAEKKEPAPAPKEEPTEPEKEAPAKPAAALAAEVKTQINENFPGGLTASSPLFAITEYEDVSTGTIRVYVQENLDKTGRGDIARAVFNMGGSDNGLKTVVVRDASGVDSNHYR